MKTLENGSFLSAEDELPAKNSELICKAATATAWPNIVRASRVKDEFTENCQRR